MDAVEPKRTYVSPLRAGQQEATRARILDAVAELMSDPRQPELTFGSVGRQAKVSERTVYRHFATKDELLEAFWVHINEQLGMVHYPETVEELLGVLPSVYTGFDRRAGLIRAHLASTAGREMRERVAPKRREIFRRMLERYVASLPAQRQREACAVMQLLFSPRAWDSLEENWGFSGQEAADACAWAIQALLGTLQAEGQAPPAAKGAGAKRKRKA
jgi:AcrR family transcriptional regulator